MENTEQTRRLKKVMVIDDTSLDLIIAQQAMKKYEFANEVVLKDSVRSGLEYLQSLELTPALLPQLIFLDINMPELSGFDFLNEYSNLPSVIQSSCIIMMLSTSLNHEDHERANSNIFVKRFLNKPLDRSKLEMIKTDFLPALSA